MAALPIALVMQLAATPACSFPGMVPQFWPHVIRKESSYDPLALHDDTTGQSYYPDTIDGAEAVARRLMAEGHSVGVGLSQLTAHNEQKFQAKFGLTIRQALDACANMRVGARFFVRGALSIYNSGSPDRSAQYALSITDTIKGDTQALSTAPTVAPNDPVVFSPGVRDAKRSPPSWDVWATEPDGTNGDAGG